jgi:hypothetical protein
MNIFFDVDYTILGLDDSLRPGTRETFRKLKEDGHQVYIWSGVGLRWEVVRKHDLEGLVSGVYEKPTHHYQERLSELGVDVCPEFVVDDYPEVASAFGGVWVPPYFFKRNGDQQMERIYGIIAEYVHTGDSQDKQYRSKGSVIPLF